MQTITLRKGISVFTATLYLLAFIIPFVFSSPQLITGTIINCVLFLSATRLSKKKLIPFIVLPSLGTIAHGVLFGPKTVFLYYFLPFIWISNYVLISLFSSLKSHQYAIRVIISSISKYLILQLFAQLYYRGGIVPVLFLSSMGYIQLITALLGGLVSYGFNKTLIHERR